MNYSNPRKAEWQKRVNQMCRECLYDQHSMGNWRQQISACTAYTCPLWEVRPIAAGHIPRSEPQSFKPAQGVRMDLMMEDASGVQNDRPGGLQ